MWRYLSLAPMEQNWIATHWENLHATTDVG
jgi:hypothetical protein